MVEPIRLDELLAELERLGIPAGASDDGFTTRELCAHWQCRADKALFNIGRFIEAGLMVAGRSTRPAVDGTMRYVPVYRFVSQHKKRKGKK